MSTILICIASIVSAVATVFIARFTKSNLELSKKIHELSETMKNNSESHQKTTEKLHIDLVATQLYSATNPSGKSLSTKKLEEYRSIVSNSLNE